jgi:ABC-type antimicrobial peptide transport system permease subunit
MICRRRETRDGMCVRFTASGSGRWRRHHHRVRASGTAWAAGEGWSTVIPVQAWAGGLGAALLIGALAGLLPAIRAARLSPTEALRMI